YGGAPPAARARANPEENQRRDLLESVVAGFLSCRGSCDFGHVAVGGLALSAGEGSGRRRASISRQRIEENGPVDGKRKEGAVFATPCYRLMDHRLASPYFSGGHRHRR